MVLAFNGSVSVGVRNITGTEVSVTDLMPGTEYNVSITTNDRFGLVEEGAVSTEVTCE